MLWFSFYFITINLTLQSNETWRGVRKYGSHGAAMRAQRLQDISSRWEWRGALLSYGGNGLVVKIKHKFLRVLAVAEWGLCPFLPEFPHLLQLCIPWVNSPSLLSLKNHWSHSSKFPINSWLDKSAKQKITSTFWNLAFPFIKARW